MSAPLCPVPAPAAITTGSARVRTSAATETSMPQHSVLAAPRRLRDAFGVDEDEVRRRATLAGLGP